MLHVPVLLEESLDFLITDLSGTYLDLTFGRGSHSQQLLNRISSKGRLHAVDRDLEAVSFGKENITDPRFSIYHSNYSEIDSLFFNSNTPIVLNSPLKKILFLYEGTRIMS